MLLAGANETDIREEIASPFLTILGYARGTSNDILREFSISYRRNFLGRKKKNDPPLRGRADYVLSVAGAGRWVLEVKEPSKDITIDDIEQAITYARHPEISGSYIAILNGKRFVLMHNSQKSDDNPCVDIAISSPQQLAMSLDNILSPLAIIRDCSPPVVDLDMPLAPGLRSKAAILGGTIRYADATWDTEPNGLLEQLPEQKTYMDQACGKLSGFRSAITGGQVWRDESSRVKAQLLWDMPHDMLLKFALDKKLMEAEYVCLDQSISAERDNLSVFDVVGQVNVSAGERLFNILNWDTQILNTNAKMTYRGQARGYISNNVFSGSFQSETEMVFPQDLFIMSMYVTGEFNVKVD